MYEADDGETALDTLKENVVDALLLDLNMPKAGRDGFDVLNYVYEHRRALPVILLSGMAPDHIQHKMHALRKRELPTLLLKPVDPFFHKHGWGAVIPVHVSGRNGKVHFGMKF